MSLTVVGFGSVAAALCALGFVVLWRQGMRAAGPQVGSDKGSPLTKLGYQSAGPKKWTLPVDRSRLSFEERPEGGGRWTVQLTRYNTLSWQVEERQHPPEGMLGAPFSTSVAALEERFVMSSERPAQCIALATNGNVARCMLSMPHLSLLLRGDELVIDDSAGRGLARLVSAGKVAPGNSAEFEWHRGYIALVTVILNALYAPSGTLFTEHR